jgi:ribosomal protein L27
LKEAKGAEMIAKTVGVPDGCRLLEEGETVPAGYVYYSLYGKRWAGGQDVFVGREYSSKTFALFAIRTGIVQVKEVGGKRYARNMRTNRDASWIQIPYGWEPIMYVKNVPKGSMIWHRDGQGGYWRECGEHVVAAALFVKPMHYTTSLN